MKKKKKREQKPCVWVVVFTKKHYFCLNIFNYFEITWITKTKFCSFLFTLRFVSIFRQYGIFFLNLLYGKKKTENYTVHSAPLHLTHTQIFSKKIYENTKLNIYQRQTYGNECLQEKKGKWTDSNVFCGTNFHFESMQIAWINFMRKTVRQT